jgi:hypothetical protein
VYPGPGIQGTGRDGDPPGGSCARPTADWMTDGDWMTDEDWAARLAAPVPEEGRTCACNGGPKCRHDHRRKQHPRWQVDQVNPGTFRWTAPSGRTCTTEPTRYPT